jgi:C4-type Zn-finger protein
MEHVEVPCSMCGLRDSGQLTFYEMRIPHFGKSELMAFSCSACGYKYNRVTTQNVRTAEDNKGRTHRLHCACPADLNREVVLGEHSTLKIPSLEVEAQVSEGRYTTVEGLLRSTANHLARAGMAFDDDDSSAPETSAMDRLKQDVDDLIGGVSAATPKGFTIEIYDPLSVSYISSVPTKGGPSDRGILSEDSIDDHHESDGRLVVDIFERTPEQNEELGLVPSSSSSRKTDLFREGFEETAQTFPNVNPNPAESNDEDPSIFARAVEAMAAEFTRAYAFEETAQDAKATVAELPQEPVGEDVGTSTTEDTVNLDCMD